MLGKLEYRQEKADFRDPNRENLVADVSMSSPVDYGCGTRRVVVIDCGCKNNIIRSLVRRGVAVGPFPGTGQWKREV